MFTYWNTKSNSWYGYYFNFTKVHQNETQTLISSNTSTFPQVLTADHLISCVTPFWKFCKQLQLNIQSGSSTQSKVIRLNYGEKLTILPANSLKYLKNTNDISSHLTFTTRLKLKNYIIWQKLLSNWTSSKKNMVPTWPLITKEFFYNFIPKRAAIPHSFLNIIIIFYFFTIGIIITQELTDIPSNQTIRLER